MVQTPNYKLEEIVAGQAGREYIINLNSRRIDAYLAGVITKTLSAPPGSPPEGAYYIVGASPTGAWVNKANYLAIYINGAWDFIAPTTGTKVWIIDELSDYRYNGTAWVANVLGNVPSGGTTGQILTKNSNTSGDYSWQNSNGGLGNPSINNQFLISQTNGTRSWISLPYAPIIAVSDEVTELTTGLKMSITIRNIPSGFTTVSVPTWIAEVNTAPTGSNLSIDVKKNGTSIFTTKLSIDTDDLSSTTASIPFVLTTNPNPVTFINGDILSIYVDQVGSTVAGAGLKIYPIGTVV